MAERPESPSSSNLLCENASHEDFMRIVNKHLAALIKTDPLLCELPEDVTTDEAKSLIALHHGQSMMIYVRRFDGKVYKVIVEQLASVLDLKKAVERTFNLQNKRRPESAFRDVRISWRYVWKSFWLYFEGQKLTENKAKLKDYGVRNNSEITFIKRLRNK